MSERLLDVLFFFDGVGYNTVGLLFVVLGVFLLIRMTGFPDLTVDGSFTIGAAVFAVLLVNGFGTPLSLIGATLAGAIGGTMTWAINAWLGVGKVVSGVLSMLILILTAPYVATSTMSLQKTSSWFSWLDTQDERLTAAIAPSQPGQLHIIFSTAMIVAFVVVAFLLVYFLRRKTGLRLRYAGDAKSPTLLSVRERIWLTLLGLSIGNGLVALGGAIEAQRRGGYTVNMGLGIILVALSVLILGEAIVKTFKRRDFLHLAEYLVAAVVGTVIYSCGIQFILWFDLAFADLRLMTSLFLLLLLGIAGQFYSSSTRLF